MQHCRVLLHGYIMCFVQWIWFNADKVPYSAALTASDVVTTCPRAEASCAFLSLYVSGIRDGDYDRDLGSLLKLQARESRDTWSLHPAGLRSHVYTTQHSPSTPSHPNKGNH